MKLEKSNEICWSIKRKNQPGTFSLRSTETRGVITKISISLNDTINETIFEMNFSEFQNFFGILSSFKDLLESPEFFHEDQSNFEEIPYSDKKKAPIQKINVPPPASNSFDFEKLAESIDNIKFNKSEISTPIENNIEKEEPKKQILKETDWDPW